MATEQQIDCPLTPEALSDANSTLPDLMRTTWLRCTGSMHGNFTTIRRHRLWQLFSDTRQRFPGIISDEDQEKETAIPKTPAAPEASRPTAFPTEPIAEAGKASAGADRVDSGGGRRSVAAALNAGVAPTASPESPSPTEQNLPRVLWDRPPGRAPAAGSEGPRPPSAPAAGPECSPQLPPRRTDFVVQRGADSQSEISKFCQQTPPGQTLDFNSRSCIQVHSMSSTFTQLFKSWIWPSRGLIIGLSFDVLI